MSFKASGIHFSYLITALGLVAMADRVYADEQTVAQKTDTSVVAEGISSNPGAVDVRTGTGELADTIEGLVGLPRDAGVFLEACSLLMQIAYLPAAPIRASGASTGSLLSQPALMRRNWSAGQAAASVSSFCSSTVSTQINRLAACRATILCLARSHCTVPLYQLWWRQELFDRTFILRIGRVAPTNDFNNVLRPVPVQDQHLAIPAVSGLLYTPVFINPTLLGAMPGYYNSAYGITATLTPIRNLYCSYGVYDGNIAHGVQTGLRGARTLTAITSTSEKRAVLGK